ncbi:MAG: flippase-like domain-containing protein [Paludibacter sp.]|nr:flippase-like domain-containing protein [Bacteroidales bacterium]MCM1068516.1 flippase-like domain-containing protein [Prevotella sp.]MCM1353470.1 flippase-like domain-containing protein [Bacteroides sp.]MCM1442631.1 flippase-like domain-containing protein [Muribaculum sp.]MCM1481476.1 flippase-like domain-containing protein [Paludibacter sp.]
MHKKKRYIRIFNIILVIAAYGYLIYTLYNFPDYALLAAHFRQCGWLQYGSLAAAILLFPLNILLESIKWRYLLRDIEPMTLREAQAQTYYGFVGAFLTPSRLGDYPTRVTRITTKEHWLSAIALGFVGTLALAFVMLFLGMPSCLFFFSNLLSNHTSRIVLTIVCISVLILQILLVVMFPQWSVRFARSSRLNERMRSTLSTLSKFSHQRFLTTCLLSFLRYTVYCLQLYLVLVFCGIEFTWIQALIAIPTYYVLITIMPSIPIADAAVKGSWSVIVFSAFSNNTAGIAIAAILLWVINTILPMLVGTFVPTLYPVSSNEK